MDLQILAFLHSHGLSTKPKVLEEMLTEAIEQLPSVVYSQHELTPVEAKELDEAGFDLSPRDLGREDPLARSVTLYAGMLAKSLSVKEAASLLGVNTSRVRQRLSKERTLYGIKLRSKWRVPTFQFENGKLIPGIGDVLASLPPSLNPVAVLSWFTNPNPDLEIEPTDPSSESNGRRLSPREWLLLGNRPEVVAALAGDL